MHMMMLQMVFVFGHNWRELHCKEKKNMKHHRGQQTHNQGESNHMPTGHSRNLPILGKWYDHLTWSNPYYREGSALPKFYQKN